MSLRVVLRSKVKPRGVAAAKASLYRDWEKKKIIHMKSNLILAFLLLSLSGWSQEIGLQLYSVRNEVKKDLKETLQKVRAMGIKELRSVS